MTEDERIARIAAILGGGAGAIVGIGDDAAVLDARDQALGPLVWTIDEQVEDVHFTRALCSFEDIGFRATMAAASDLAAMGARPLGALAALVVPPSVGEGELESIARGQREACDALALEGAAGIVGGNLSRGDKLSIATTWLGTATKPILRSGARPGDGVFVCGDVGLAGAGFRALVAAMESPDAVATQAWRRPRARILEGLRMAAVASAAIDVSDGLAKDALHVSVASHVRVVLDEAALHGFVHPATVAIAGKLGIEALDLALGGGEDYALLCTSSAPTIEGFTRIGSIERGEGVVLRSDHDRHVSAGFDHFA